jgi:hypothetical protein
MAVRSYKRSSDDQAEDISRIIRTGSRRAPPVATLTSSSVYPGNSASSLPVSSGGLNSAKTEGNTNQCVQPSQVTVTADAKPKDISHTDSAVCVPSAKSMAFTFNFHFQ